MSTDNTQDLPVVVYFVDLKLFDLGRMFITPGAQDALIASGEEPWDFLGRHVTGDWGIVDEEDAQANQDSLKDGSRLLSAYHTHAGVKVWVITEADRHATTILLPSEY